MASSAQSRTEDASHYHEDVLLAAAAEQIPISGLV